MGCLSRPSMEEVGWRMGGLSRQRMEEAEVGEDQGRGRLAKARMVRAKLEAGWGISYLGQVRRAGEATRWRGGAAGGEEGQAEAGADRWCRDGPLRPSTGGEAAAEGWGRADLGRYCMEAEEMAMEAEAGWGISYSGQQCRAGEAMGLRGGAASVREEMGTGFP